MFSNFSLRASSMTHAPARGDRWQFRRRVKDYLGPVARVLTTDDVNTREAGTRLRAHTHSNHSHQQDDSAKDFDRLEKSDKTAAAV
jgi:hypothetical protein